MPSFTWSGWDGGMRPVTPVSGVPNPVTLIENFIRRNDGVLVRRSGFSTSAFAVTPRNHIVCNPVGSDVPLAVIKADTAWYYKNDKSIPTILDVTSLPAEVQNPSSGVRGSFGVFGDELYYCDAESIWRWDGSSDVLSATGMPYYDLGDPSAEFDYCATIDPSEEDTWWLNDCDFNGDCEQTNPDCNLRSGSKSGSFAVSYSWYDPVRNIYGPRSKPTTSVIAAYSGGPVRLFGWNITIPTPSTDYSSTYDIVIWCSQAVSIELLQRQFDLTNGDVTYVLSHQVGDELSDLHFYEGKTSQIGDNFVLRKDNATLAKDGPALDVYEPPHPSDFMVILTDGTTLYFNPNSLQTGDGTKRHNIEYSVGHPEQVGRDSAALSRRAANGPTITYAANQKGKMIASISSTGGSALALTNQEVYVIRFSQGVVDLVPQGQNRGVRGINSITESPMGLSYMADEGHVLIAGNQSALIDEEIGYSTYTYWLTNNQKKNTAGGFQEDNIFLWMPDFDPFTLARTSANPSGSNRSALVYNHADRFLCKFRLGEDLNVAYAYGAHLDDGNRIFCYTGAEELHWPSTAKKDSGENFSSRAVMWLNERQTVNKKVRSVTVEYGNVSPSGPSGPEVIVTGYEHWNDPTTRVTPRRADSTNYSGTTTRNKRVTYSEFAGMEGRFFEIEVRTDSGTSGGIWSTGEFEIVSVTVEYDMEVEEGHLGAPGVNS